MSLNHFTDNGFSDNNNWMNINCNTISFSRTGQLKTQASGGNYIITPPGTLIGFDGVYYTCDRTSLRMKSKISFTSGSVLTNSYKLSVEIPGELQPYFGTSSGYADVVAIGYITEEKNNNNCFGFLVETVRNGNRIECFFNLNQNNTIQTNYNALLDISLFKQG